MSIREAFKHKNSKEKFFICKKLRHGHLPPQVKVICRFLVQYDTYGDG
jgi:hypothetical protein